MEIKVYADVLFLNDLFMDFLLIYMSAKLMKIKPSFFKILVAATVGAMFSTVMFFNTVNSLLLAVLKIAVMLLMIEISFFPCSLIGFLKKTAVFFAVFLCVGGSSFSLLYFTPMGAYFGAVLKEGTIYINFPVYKLILSCSMCYFILTLATKVIKKYKYRRDIYDTTMTFNGNKISFKAFYDSGNCLREQKTDKGVLVIRWKTAKKLFDTKEDFLEFVKDNSERFTPIPYKTISGNSVMMGFLPDNVKIGKDKIDVYVGISEVDFCDSYDGILPNNFDERSDRD